MSKSKTILIVIAVVGVGLLLGWLGTTGRKDAAPPATEVVSTPIDADPVRSNRNPIFPSSRTNRGSSRPGIDAAGNALPATGSADSPANLITNWEDRVDQILTSDGLDADKAKQMLEMFPRLTEEGQVEVAQHLSNLVPDEDYAPLGKFLIDPKLPEDVQDELMADILNRPNGVKLPYLLEVAKEPDHAKASEAKDLLELFLEEDYGTDWSKWRTKMDEWLKENPD